MVAMNIKGLLIAFYEPRQATARIARRQTPAEKRVQKGAEGGIGAGSEFVGENTGSGGYPKSKIPAGA
jgi:hypothetical protein